VAVHVTKAEIVVPSVALKVFDLLSNVCILVIAC